MQRSSGYHQSSEGQNLRSRSRRSATDRPGSNKMPLLGKKASRFIGFVVAVIFYLFNHHTIHHGLANYININNNNNIIINNSSSIIINDNKRSSLLTSSLLCTDEENILTEECMRTHARDIARAFPLVPGGMETWCVPSTKINEDVKNDRGEWQGLLLVKVPKAGSSTVAGLTYHLNNINGGMETGIRCAAQGLHYEEKNGMNRAYGNRDTNRSFLFAPIRKPASHAVSFIQFFRFAGGTVKNAEPTIGQYREALLGKRGHHNMKLWSGTGGYQFEYIRHRPFERLVSKDGAIFHDKKIRDALKEEFMTHYGFFMVTERIDESIVVLANLLGLTNMSEVVMPSNAKVRDGRYEYSKKTKTCYRRRSYPKPPVNFTNYLENSREFKRITYADQLLYLAANYSLDMTIEETIGFQKFNNDLAQFRRLKSKVQDYCGLRLSGGCYPNGTVMVPREKCYIRDFGCGYECVNEYFNSETNKQRT